MPYIAEGTYGCGFFPHLECTNKTTIKDAMGKIYSNPVSFEEEKDISQYIQKIIDPANTFTIPYYDSCETNIAQARETDNVNRCSHTALLRRTGIPETEQLMFRYGGVDLKKLTENFAAYTNLYIDDFIPLLVPLVSGIITLHKHKYVHCDIKPPNILYDDKKGQLYLIDFGMLTKSSEIGQQTHMISFAYPYYPPEFKVYHYINEQVHPNLMPGKVSTNFQYYDQKKWFEFLSSFCNIEDNLMTVMKSFVPQVMKDPSKFQQDFEQHFVNKTDIYSLGISFLEICFILNQEGLLKVRNKSLFNDFMITIIPTMINYDPYKRAYPKDVLAALTKLLESHKVPSSPVLKKTPIKTKIPTPDIPSPKSKTKSPQSLHGDCMKLKRAQIIDLLKARHLPTSGTKKVLCERLNALQTSHSETFKTPDIPSPKSRTPLQHGECMKLTRAQIVELLRARHLPVSGNKQTLCERLNTRVFKTVNMDMDKCKKLKKAVIQEKLQARNLPTIGTKESLCKRLFDHINS